MISEQEIKATNFDTMRHIERVRNLLGEVCVRLLDRAKLHDQSKLVEPEASGFAEVTHQLASVTYGSEEYRGFLKKLDPILQHHYGNNRHHPEHHKNGIDDMTLDDLTELLCDWKAASERHNDGNIKKSIEHNADRFGISPQLVRILENTAKEWF
jgi:hypothetical protein